VKRLVSVVLLMPSLILVTTGKTVTKPLFIYLKEIENE